MSLRRASLISFGGMILMNTSVKLGHANLQITLEAFVVLHAVQYVTGYHLLPFLLRHDLGLPPMTVSMLSTSSTSLLLAVLYVLLRTKAVPIFIGPNVISASIAGIFLLWMVSFISLIWFDKTNPQARELLDLQGAPFYLSAFSIVVWGPFLEEILFRGYFFELLIDQIGTLASATLSAALFVISHAVWEGFGPQSVLYFVDSLVFTFIYAQGGVLAAGLGHSFRNAYVLLLNI